MQVGITSQQYKALILSAGIFTYVTSYPTISGNLAQKSHFQFFSVLRSCRRSQTRIVQKLHKHISIFDCNIAPCCLPTVNICWHDKQAAHDPRKFKKQAILVRRKSVLTVIRYRAKKRGLLQCQCVIMIIFPKMSTVRWIITIEKGKEERKKERKKGREEKGKKGRKKGRNKKWQKINFILQFQVNRKLQVKAEQKKKKHHNLINSRELYEKVKQQCNTKLF